MKKTIFFTAIMAGLLFTNDVQAAVSLVRNGSFEYDGQIADVTVKPPKYFCDVNVPTTKFGGYVDTTWSTYINGGYSLTLYSKYDAKCNAGDKAMVSQQVYLTDVNEIIFDLEVSSSYSSSPWDPNLRSALVLIDGSVVWDSNDWTPDSNDEYRNQTIDVNEIYKDENPHTLSLAIRSNVTEVFKPYVEYRTRWDFVKFDTHCGGFGYLPEDLDRDCYIDFVDFAMLAGHWLEPDPDYEHDLFEDEDNIINELDLMVFSDGWLDNSDWRNYQEDNCYEAELLASDLNDDGVVDLRDFAILAGYWRSGQSCIRADVDNSGEVDYDDISVMADEWLQRSWVYGLE